MAVVDRRGLGADQTTRDRPTRPAVPQADRNDLAELAALITDSAVRPVIGDCFHLPDTADAVRRIETGHATGKIVITNCRAGAGLWEPGASIGAVARCPSTEGTPQKRVGRDRRRALEGRSIFRCTRQG